VRAASPGSVKESIRPTADNALDENHQHGYKLRAPPIKLWDTSDHACECQDLRCYFLIKQICVMRLSAKQYVLAVNLSGSRA
jgi:hypothetical protein